MSAIPERIQHFLWSKQEQSFKQGVGLAAPCWSFFSMQVIRFILIFFLVGIWAANFYVNVKKCVLYLNFWALTATLLYLLFVFPSAGRQAVER